MALTVTIPEVTVTGISGFRFVAEKPIILTCTTVRFPDGNVLVPAQAQQFGFRLYRKSSAGTVQAWNETSKSWAPETPAPEPEPLAFIDDTWRSVLVAIGQQDNAGHDKFATDPSSGFPKYFVRCVFSATDNAGLQHDGVSPPSAEFTVSAAGTRNRAGLATVPLAITEATEIRLYLKDAALAAERGVIAIRQSGGGYEIDLTVGSTRIQLTSAGDIRLDGDVAIQGTLSVNGTVMHVP
jgi:hypothetical protein